MAHYRNSNMVSAIMAKLRTRSRGCFTNRRATYLIAVLPIYLLTSGCGGSGGGSDSNPPAVAVTPTPTPTPTPSPTPPPTPASIAITAIGAPAIATAPPNPVSPQSSAGASFVTQPTPSITFPVLQSTLAISNNTLVADLDTMNGGSSFDFAYCVGCRPTFSLTVPGVGISKVSLNTFADNPFSATLPDGRDLYVEEGTWGFSDLGSVMFGYWEVGKPFPSYHSGYVYGYETPASGLPTSGTLTYTGRVVGRAFSPTFPLSPATAIQVYGNVSVQVDFATRTVTGQLVDMRTVGSNVPWNGISFSASFAPGAIQSTGTTATTASANGVALGGSATGTVAARFYGPNGRELGLVWTLYDGTRAAIGSAGMRN